MTEPLTLVQRFNSTPIRRMTTGGNYVNMTADVVLASDYDRLSAELAEARKPPPGWPDPLQSPQAEAIRAGKIDDTSIRDLFDRMERELQQHRLQFVEQQAEIERLSKSNQIYDAIFNDKGRVLFYSESIVRRVRAAHSFLASKEASHAE